MSRAPSYAWCQAIATGHALLARSVCPASTDMNAAVRTPDGKDSTLLAHAAVVVRMEVSDDVLGDAQ